MAYQDVGRPRFYVNVLEWLNKLDVMPLPMIPMSISDPSIIRKAESVFHTLPVTPFYHPARYYQELPIIDSILSLSESPNWFVAMLGHELPPIDYAEYDEETGLPIGDAVSGSYQLFVSNGEDDGAGGIIESETIIGLTSVINRSCEHPGFSISTFDGGILSQSSPSGDGLGRFGVQTVGYPATLPLGTIGSIVIGTYFDMPVSPDLSVSVSREFGGIKEVTTRGGASISNTLWSRAPNWGNRGAWVLGEHDQDYAGDNFTSALARTGRRIWELSFSYIDDSSLFPEISNLTDIETGIEDSSGKMLMDSNDFFSRVWHRTLGGTLPFIFQPDRNDVNQFAICRFTNTFKATQTAPGFYDIALSIEEVY